MRIKKITLKNGYKRFMDTTIEIGDAPKKIIALVGRNGSGKSSVFDGMLYIQNQFAQIGEHGGKEIENYLLDFEIVTAAYPSIAFEDYEKIVPDANASDVKELVSQVMSLCTGGGNISKRDFLINLAKKVTPETKIYAELQTVIF